MGFEARFLFPKKVPPGRAYLHTAGLEGYRTQTLSPVDGATTYLKKILKDEELDLKKYDFLLATLWVKNGVKTVDVCGLSGISNDDWDVNAEIDGWVIEDGIYIPQKAWTCEDSAITFGRECEFRRRSDNMEEFKYHWPNLSEVNLEPEHTIDLDVEGVIHIDTQDEDGRRVSSTHLNPDDKTVVQNFIKDLKDKNQRGEKNE